MKREISPRLWAVLIGGIMAVVGFAVLLLLLKSGPADPDPMATQPLPTESPTATSSVSPLSPLSPLATAAPTVPPTPTTQAHPTPRIPDVAADFTLDRPGGGAFTLSDQLTQGPVVLVFFRSIGG